MNLDDLKQGDSVQVAWQDITGVTTWTPMGEFISMKVEIIQTLGFFCQKTEEFLYLASTWNKEGEEINDGNIIPLACVKGVIKLDG